MSGLLGILMMASAMAENAIVLESFETSIDGASKGTWASASARLPDGVALTQYTKTGSVDPYVTDGSKSLRVELTLDDGWSQDFTLTLSAEASALLRSAASSPDTARYILRYDVILVPPPGGEVRSLNHAVYVGDLHDQLMDLKQGKYTMSIALDLLSGLSLEGQVVIRVADNFASLEQPFVGPLILYVDNLRVVDTYVPGAVPLTYTLQSFEDDALPTGGVEHIARLGGVPRTTSSRYGPTSGSDLRVSDGAYALHVDFSGEGRCERDFRLPLQGTKLADVLKLDRPVQERPSGEQLSHYTLRFDILFPDLTTDWTQGWMLSTFATPSEPYPVTKGRRDGWTGRRETFSMTLDQVLWGEAAQGAPALIFSHSGGWGPLGTTLFYDDFRLIDTGSVTLPSDPPIITLVRYNTTTSQIHLAWRGIPGRTYDVEYASLVGSGNSVLFTDVACPQGQAAVTGVIPNIETGFFRVRQKD